MFPDMLRLGGNIPGGVILIYRVMSFHCRRINELKSPLSVNMSHTTCVYGTFFLVHTF